MKIKCSDEDTKLHLIVENWKDCLVLDCCFSYLPDGWKPVGAVKYRFVFSSAYERQMAVDVFQGRLKFNQMPIPRSCAYVQNGMFVRTNFQMFQPIQSAITPPASAELLLHFLVHRNHRENLLGDLEEIFHQKVKRYGRRKAVLIYWWDALAAAADLQGVWLRRVFLAILAKLGLQAIISHFFKLS